MDDHYKTAASRQFTLVDGRQLAYQLLGDTQSGKPVLFFHGTPGSHRLGYVAAEAARAAGLCLICPDRPGMGDSSFQPKRELRHYPLDIVQLLHHLEIEAVPLVAISGGTPHALQCAFDLPQQITSLIILSGWLSAGLKEAQGIVLPKPTEQMRRLLLKWRWVLPALGPLVRKLVLKKPNLLLKHLMPQLPEADKILFTENHALREIFLADIQNAYKQSWRGPVQEGQLQFSAPDYVLAQIEQPTTLIHGKEDTIAPFAMAEAMVKHLPNIKEFIEVEQGGHLCSVDYLPNLLRSL